MLLAGRRRAARRSDDLARLCGAARRGGGPVWRLAAESEQSLVRSVDLIRDILGAGDRDLELDTVVELCPRTVTSTSS